MRIDFRLTPNTRHQISDVGFPRVYDWCCSKSGRRCQRSLGPLLLRVVGHLPQTDGAASSGGRCRTSLKGGNRGPITQGGAAFYGESVIDPLGWIGRSGSTPLRRSARDGFRAAVRGMSRPSSRRLGARGGKRIGHLAERRRV